MASIQEYKFFFRLHDRQLWSAQTSSDLKLPQESDSDSINDYAGGTVGKSAVCLQF